MLIKATGIRLCIVIFELLSGCNAIKMTIASSPRMQDSAIFIKTEVCYKLSVKYVICVQVNVNIFAHSNCVKFR